MMSFEQIRSLAVLDPEQADEEAQRTRPRVRIVGTNETATLIEVDDCGSAVIERDDQPAYWISFQHLEAA
jgi:hypothetical protein